MAGSNWIYDTTVRRMVEDKAVVLILTRVCNLPQRLERAESPSRKVCLCSTSSDWVTVSSAPEIPVPGDAWADWDAVNQKWLTVSEVYTDTQTALTKSVVYYPSELWNVQVARRQPDDPGRFHDGDDLWL